MHASEHPLKSPGEPARRAPLPSGHGEPCRHRPPPFPQTPRGRRSRFCKAPGEADLEENARATAHGSPAPPRGYQAAPPPRRGAGRPDLPTLAGAAASLRRADRGRRSRTSPPQAAEAAAAAARARLPKPAGGRSAAEVDRRHPALASPPPVSSLSPPGPRPRPLRRQGPRRLRRSRPGPPSATS